MPREAIFSRPTRLWNALEPGGWREFPAGEQDPGPAWSETEGGAPDVGSKPSAAMLKELTGAITRAELAESRVASLEHDCAQRNQEATNALAKVAELEEQLIAANRAASEAEELKLRFAAERDRAIDNEAAIRRQLEANKGLIQEYETDLANAKAKGSKKAPALAGAEDGSL